MSTQRRRFQNAIPKATSERGLGGDLPWLPPHAPQALRETKRMLKEVGLKDLQGAEDCKN